MHIWNIEHCIIIIFIQLWKSLSDTFHVPLYFFHKLKSLNTLSSRFVLSYYIGPILCTEFLWLVRYQWYILVAQKLWYRKRHYEFDFIEIQFFLITQTSIIYTGSRKIMIQETRLRIWLHRNSRKHLPLSGFAKWRSGNVSWLGDTFWCLNFF